MKWETKSNIYMFSNLFAWILLSAGAVWAIHRYVDLFVLRCILYPVAVVGLAYFEERIFCKLVCRIVALVIHDEDIISPGDR